MEGRTHGETVLGGETLSGLTKLGKTTETKLKRIAQRSGENPCAEFNWLMPHFNKESLIGCFNELDGRKAVGADGQTKEVYGKSLVENIKSLIERMKRMSYRPGPVREVLIPKEGKRSAYRPLGISNFEDKIVQLMISKILNAIYEPIFRDCSYGFRLGRNCHEAVKAVRGYLYSHWCEIVIDVDIKNFFDTINHEVLISFLRMKIKDERFIRYIIRILKAGVLSKGEFRVTEEGSPQGNVASPILSNVYAHYVIDCWFQDIVKKHVRGPVELIRYCDDMVICCRYRRDADRIRKALEGRLEKYSLRLNMEKTKLISFDKKAYANGIRQETFDFLGFTFYLGRSRRGYVIVKVKTSKERIRSKLRNVKRWIKVNRSQAKLMMLWFKFAVKLRGHVRYYGVSFNTNQVSIFLNQSKRIFFKWINRRSQRKSLTWEQFNKLIQKHPLPKAKIHHPLF